MRKPAAGLVKLAAMKPPVPQYTVVNTATVRNVDAVTVALRRSGCLDSNDSSPKHDPSLELKLKPRPQTPTLPYHVHFAAILAFKYHDVVLGVTGRRKRLGHLLQHSLRASAKQAELEHDRAITVPEHMEAQVRGERL